DACPRVRDAAHRVPRWGTRRRFAAPEMSASFRLATLDGQAGSGAEANVRGRYGVIVLCVKTGDDVDVIPAADKRIEKSDIIVVAGPTKSIDRLAR
ncbi:MAG: TrkA-C domain, partial [Chloroflexota bacterium]|nr:TrkA-C domain [Chloroflexota bacterium]